MTNLRDICAQNFVKSAPGEIITSYTGQGGSSGGVVFFVDILLPGLEHGPGNVGVSDLQSSILFQRKLQPFERGHKSYIFLWSKLIEKNHFISRQTIIK